jgi:hypothetical protein
MALGNNNTNSGLGDLPWKKMLENITPDWLKPKPKPLPTPTYTVPPGTTRYDGYDVGFGSDACLAWMTEHATALIALQEHDGRIADVVQALTNTLLSERDECAKQYKDSYPPISTIGFMVCQHNAMERFNKAVGELQTRNQAARDALLLRVTRAKEALDFWCTNNGWPPNGQPLPNQQFYPVPPPNPGFVGRRWGGTAEQ